MKITVNGEALSLAEGSSLQDLLAALGRHPRTVAVEHNGEILPRSRFEGLILAEGDRLELVHFVQGG